LTRIAHLSDTHLGHRPGDVRDIRPQRMYRALEDDFYRAWSLVIEDIINRGVDFVVHSGDLFDSPWSRSSYPPPEVARNRVAEGLEKLERAGIPVAILGGNHGYYLGYRVSTLEGFEIAFDNVHAFTYWNFVEAFNRDIPLKRDFDDFTFYAFPYVDPSFLETIGYAEKYRQWIRRIRPENGRLSIAACHGSSIDDTLDPYILTAGFEYVALGHDHTRKKLTDHAWYAGSTERWTFKEADQSKGYLLVEVEEGSRPRVEEIDIPPRRSMINEIIKVEPGDTTLDIRNKIWGLFEKNDLIEPFEYETAGRVKVTVTGRSSQETTTRLYRELETIKSEALRSDELNIIQFRYERPTRDAIGYHPGPTYADIKYLIENPRDELLEYLKEKGIEEDYDLEMMAELFGEAIKSMEERA